MGASAGSSLATSHVPRLMLLGGFGLNAGHEQFRTSRSAQRLLAFLAVHHERPVFRTVISERLWSEADPHHASSRLRSTLWRLPRPHGMPLVVTTRGQLQLASHVHVDLWESEKHAHEIAQLPAGQPLPNVPALRHVFSHDLLPDWYDDWLVVEQETYRQVRLHALENLSARLCAAGQHTAALLAGLAAVAGEPLRESAHRRVIEAHLGEGNDAEALREYQLYRRLLADELGLPPSPAIRHLVSRLLGRPIDRTQ